MIYTLKEIEEIEWQNTCIPDAVREAKSKKVETDSPLESEEIIKKRIRENLEKKRLQLSKRKEDLEDEVNSLQEAIDEISCVLPSL